jgi:hypothetical protein
MRESRGPVRYGGGEGAEKEPPQPDTLIYTPVQKDPHFLFLLSTTASPTICQAACTVEEDFISDYNRGFIFADESGWQFKLDPHLSPLQKPERQRA